jgi:hypothetical protein
MSTIVTRTNKGFPLTWVEMDNNLNNLNYGSYISVKDTAYGAKGDNVTDDTAACQAAINAVAAAGGGIVYFPMGSYSISRLNITGNQITLLGSNRGSYLNSNDNVNSVIYIGSSISNTQIKDLGFSTKTGTVRTGGDFIWSYGNEVSVINCRFIKGNNGIYFGSSSSKCLIDNCSFLNFDNNNSGSVIAIVSSGSNFIINSCFIDNTSDAVGPDSGIYIGRGRDITISNCNIFHCRYGLYITTYSTNSVTSLFCSNTLFNSSSTGMFIAPFTDGSISRCHFINCSASYNTNKGIFLSGIQSTLSGICFTDVQVNLNTGAGISIAGPNTSDLVFNGGQAAGNNTGFYTDALSTGFYLRHFHAGSGFGLNGNTHGVYIDSGATNYEISNCVIQNNITTQFTDAAKTGRVFRNYNTAGVKTYNRGTGSITIGSTTTTITHGLNTTPNLGEINITPTISYGNNWLYLVPGSIGATTFQVASQTTVAGSNFTFSWSASCQNDY